MSTTESHSPLNISETVSDRDLVPKDHRVYQMVMRPMTSRDPEGQTRDPNTLRAQYLENSYLAIIRGSTVGTETMYQKLETER